MKFSKVSVAWECKHCGERHLWKWEDKSFFSGQVNMICDYCDKKTLANLQRIGSKAWAAFWL